MYFIVGLLFAGLPFACIADPVPDHVLTLEDASRMSLDNQPALRLLDSNNLANSTIRFINTDDPSLAQYKIAIEYFRKKQNLLTEDILTLGDSLIPVEQRVNVRYKRNRQVKHSPESVLLSREIARDAALAWVRLYYARHALVLEQALIGEYANQLASTQIAFRANKVSQSDIWKAEDELNAAREREVESKNRITQANADLARWIGDKPFTLDEKISDHAPPDFKEMKERLGAHPRQLMYWIAQDIADVEMRAVDDHYKPDPKSGQHLEEPLLPALKALREKLDFQADDSMRMLESELSKAWADWQTAQEILALHDKTVAPNSVRRLQATMIDYSNGKADFSAVLEARRHEIEEKMERLQLQTDVARARIQLGFYE